MITSENRDFVILLIWSHPSVRLESLEGRGEEYTFSFKGGACFEKTFSRNPMTSSKKKFNTILEAFLGAKLSKNSNFECVPFR